MLPGKKLTPEDLLGILRRRYWLLLLPFAVIAATTAVVARKLPDSYRSETLILVVPQQVPESYVKSTVTIRIEDRLQSISQQILSRTRLERVIQDFNLYEEERRTGIMEDIVERMRTKDVQIQVMRGDSFKVAYVGRDPRTVAKVTERLASLFIEENTSDRAKIAESTNQFLESQLDDARRRLIEQETRLEAYRRAHAGELPSQLESNLQAMQNTQMQIQAVVEALNRDRDRRLFIERQLADISTLAAVEMPSVAASPDAVLTGTAVQQLEGSRAQLKMMEMRYKPDHPDIGLLKRRIRDLEQKVDAEALAMPVSSGPTPRVTSPAETARQVRVTGFRQELEQLDRQIQNRLSEEQRLRALSSTYQARVEAAPARETELVELTRDYQGIQAIYGNMLANKEQSRIATNLERRQIGEQFKLLDPARVAERPFKPNRQRINLMGMAAGLAAGLLLIALLEYRDRSFNTEFEVSAVLGLPVLAIVPVMASDRERKHRFRRTLALQVGMAATVMGCLAVVAYTFLR